MLQESCGGTGPDQHTHSSPGDRPGHTAIGRWAQRSMVIAGAVAGMLGIMASADVASAQTNASWRKLSPATSPSARTQHSMVYDPVRDRMVLFGGASSLYGNGDAETWEFDGTNWVQVTTPTSPTPNARHTTVYDSTRHVVVLSGGIANGSATWEYDGTTWTQRIPANPPYGPFSFLGWFWDLLMVHVPTRGTSLLLGPNFDPDVSWEWDGTLWTPSSAGFYAWDGAIAYDSTRDRIVRFGATNANGAFFAFHNDVDAFLSNPLPLQSATPPARWGNSMDYDTQRLRMVMFGGTGNGVYTSHPGTLLNDTWEYDGATQTWAQRPSVIQPSPRMDHAMAYDSLRNRMVLFGGFTDSGSSAETWVYDTAKRLVLHTPVAHVCDQLTVQIVGTGDLSNVVGGQFFIEWDSQLSLTSAVAGAGLEIFYDVANGATGRDIAVRVPDESPPVGAQAMLTLTFTATTTDPVCDLASAVRFRSSGIPSRLTDDQAQDLGTTLVGLDPVSLNSADPVLPGTLPFQEYSADAGSCSATRTLSVDAVTCDGTVPAIASINGTPITFPYAFPVNYTGIRWTATNACGVTSSVDQLVYVAPVNHLSATVTLDGGFTGTSFTRGIQFDLYTTTPSCAIAHSVCVDVLFVDGVGTMQFDVPCGDYAAITATDPKHTLRRTTTLGTSGSSYTAAFTSTAGKALKSGNINNDAYVDILDFGGYFGKYGRPTSANTPCGTTGLNADFSGDDLVDSGDFTFIQFNFLRSRDANPCGAPLADEGPVSDISVTDLVARGMRDIALADFNLDGRVNTADIGWVTQHGLPRCAADFSADQAVDVQDIFAFLNAWFMDHPKADMNANGQTDVQDIFSFLSGWFAGCN